MRTQLLFALLMALSLAAAPLSPPDMAAAAIWAVLCAVPGLILGRRDARRACLFAFGDAVGCALPALLLIHPAISAAAVFAAVHHLLRIFLGGWLLKRQGLSCEKNFTLIPAYRATIRHHAFFPGEIHPTDEPLFQPARNAMAALIDLIPVASFLLALPFAGCMAGWMPLPRILRLYAGILLAMTLLKNRPLLPRRKPSRLTWLTILCHLPMACLPPSSYSSDDGLYFEHEEAFRWCRMAFLPIIAAIVLTQ